MYIYLSYLLYTPHPHTPHPHTPHPHTPHPHTPHPHTPHPHTPHPHTPHPHTPHPHTPHPHTPHPHTPHPHTPHQTLIITYMMHHLRTRCLYVAVWEVRPGSLKWRWLNAPRQPGYVPGRTAW